MMRMLSYSTQPRCWAIACIALMAVGSAARAQPARFEKDVSGFLAKHCVSCHSGKKPKADIVLDTARSETDRARRRSKIAFYEKHHPAWAPFFRLLTMLRGR